MDESEWRQQVTLALAEGRGEDLITLYEQAEQRWGRQEAGARWARVISGWDAGAQTG